MRYVTEITSGEEESWSWVALSSPHLDDIFATLKMSVLAAEMQQTKKTEMIKQGGNENDFCRQKSLFLALID